MSTDQNAEEKVMCIKCETLTASEDVHTVGGDKYCLDCFAEDYFVCDSCEDITSRDYAYSDDITDTEDTLCRMCYREREDEYNNENNYNEFPTRDYSTADHAQHQSTDAGKYVTSPRVFSAEVECYYPNRETLREVADALPDTIGISEDGSLSGGSGVEFQTPKLKGKAGEDTILGLCKALNDNGFSIERSAGLHLHLDGAGLMPKTRTTHYPTAIVALWTFYLVFEDVFLSFLPPSRRRNQYCTLIKSQFHAKEIQTCRTLVELEKLWYRTANRNDIKNRKGNKYDSSRYVGINLHSLFSNNHLEVRYHSGTLNAGKILEWVNLHQTVLDKAADGRLWGMPEVQSLPALADKTALFFKVLELPDRAEKYFRDRQAMFSNIEQDANESALVTMPALSDIAPEEPANA